MSGDPPGGDRSAFAERLRLQLQARYQGIDVDVDGARFALHLHGGGVDTTLPLAPLHHAVLRAPSETPAIIARYVASVDRQLTPRVATTVSLSRLLWCVRSRRSLEALSRAAELALRELPAGLAAFVAEELPGSIMRGVPREEWEAAGAGEDAVRAAAS
ncbi:MAG: hypothetical protein JOY68_01450, partial [Candidatus Dormibacteraeota bacterium]|nr:hypothetical protein [Candidatus Dormibacteraeota bacterium]